MLGGEGSGAREPEQGEADRQRPGRRVLGRAGSPGNPLAREQPGHTPKTLERKAGFVSLLIY